MPELNQAALPNFYDRPDVSRPPDAAEQRMLKRHRADCEGWLACANAHPHGRQAWITRLRWRIAWINKRLGRAQA